MDFADAGEWGECRDVNDGMNEERYTVSAPSNNCIGDALFTEERRIIGQGARREDVPSRRLLLLQGQSVACEISGIESQIHLERS